ETHDGWLGGFPGDEVSSKTANTLGIPTGEGAPPGEDEVVCPVLTPPMGTSQQRSRKLSATASSFRPFFTATVNVPDIAPRNLPRPTTLPYFLFTSQNSSSDLGLSRHLLFTTTAGSLAVTDVKSFIEVRMMQHMYGLFELDSLVIIETSSPGV